MFLISFVLPSDQKEMSIPDHYKWFKFAISKWLIIAQQRADRRVRRAVESERVVVAERQVKYSTSAVDVCGCFTQVSIYP